MDKVYSMIGETDEEYRCPPCRGWSPLSLLEKLAAQLESNATDMEDREASIESQTEGGPRSHLNICRMIGSPKEEESSEEEDAFDINTSDEEKKGLVANSLSDSPSKTATEGVWNCALCDHIGDTEQEGRLLPMQYNLWVHVNCALWSSDVLMAIDGALIGLNRVVRFARNSVIHFDWFLLSLYAN